MLGVREQRRAFGYLQKALRQYRRMLSADTASEVRHMPSQKRREYWRLQR